MSLMGAQRLVRARRHAGYIAYLVHRLSGLALAFFLPLHLLVLGNALNNAQTLDDFLIWAENPWVKLGEWLIVMSLAVHLAGGLRVLALEFFPWSEHQKTWVSVCFAFMIIVGTLFLLSRG